MRYQLFCFIAFWTFSLAVHVESVGSVMDCQGVMKLSLRQLSEVDVRKI